MGAHANTERSRTLLLAKLEAQLDAEASHLAERRRALEEGRAFDAERQVLAWFDDAWGVRNHTLDPGRWGVILKTGRTRTRARMGRPRHRKLTPFTRARIEEKLEAARDGYELDRMRAALRKRRRTDADRAAYDALAVLVVRVKIAPKPLAEFLGCARSTVYKLRARGRVLIRTKTPTKSRGEELGSSTPLRAPVFSARTPGHAPTLPFFLHGL